MVNLTVATQELHVQETRFLSQKKKKSTRYTPEMKLLRVKGNYITLWRRRWETSNQICMRTHASLLRNGACADPLPFAFGDVILKTSRGNPFKYL